MLKLINYFILLNNLNAFFIQFLVIFGCRFVISDKPFISVDLVVQ